MLLENVNKKQDYGERLENLRKIIIQTKNELTSLFSLDDTIQNSYEIIKKQTSSGESDPSGWTNFAPKYADLVIIFIVDFSKYKEFTVTCFFAANIN